ncbi:32325_t:CDS:1, partial [Gigaspora margarita]
HEEILLAVDISDNEIINILQTYIARKKAKTNMYEDDKINKNRSLQKLPKSININTMNENHIMLEEENYTNSDNCYTNNAIPDKE